jgi:phosphodiesterase/alkaline phosphatase D-like protein
VPNPQAPVRFDFGVASGDPLADRVILWRHATRGDANPVALTWEVALDAGFSQLVSTGQAQASPDAGHTAKVDATGLQAGQTYFFRFRSGEHISPVGRTRTLPALNATSVKLAVFSCANNPAGFFHAYSGALSVGAEYAVHLGDYIYEYEAGGYASEDAVALGRVSAPANECLKLADYRARYAQYRSDPDLKQLHATLPMIAIWDDHEIAENANASGSINHTEGVEGSFSARAAAEAAYLLARELEVSAPQLMIPEQLALVDPVQNQKIGYNLDAWDGYPAAREAVLISAAGLGKRLVALAGDTHNAWQSDLSLADGTVVGQEFATPSVTSPGFEAYLGSLSPSVVADIFIDVLDMLNFANTERRGFLLMSFTAQAATGDWYFIDTVKSSAHTVTLAHTAVVNA